MRIETRQPRWVVAPVAAGLVLLLLLGAIAAGLRVPGFSYLRGLPGAGLLDYRTLAATGFAPLRADYLDELLGTGFGNESLATEPADAEAPGSSDPAELPAGGLPPFVGAGLGADAPPAVLDHELTNDDMNKPIVITRLPFAARTDTTRAERADDEPSSCSRTGGTVWYRYTATRDVLLSADTFGSDHSTAVGVFRGQPRAALEQVACATDFSGNAQTAFPASRGSTYLFQVAGVVGGGRLLFHLGAPGSTSMISTADSRGPTRHAFAADVSGDGEVVVYQTQGNANAPCCGQVFAVERRTGRTTLVSKSSGGEPGNGRSDLATTSADGRYVAFSSDATNLVDGDTNGQSDLFVHDRRTGRTIRASVSSHGQQGSDDGGRITIGSLSSSGRFISFGSALGGLVPDDPPGSFDIFVRDLWTGLTTRESVTEEGNPGSRPSFESRISADGRYVAFLSNAQNLAPAHYRACDVRSSGVGTFVRGGCNNLFLRDRWQNTTRILSVDARRNADMSADRLDMSNDGSVIAWTTTSALDGRDTNGVSDVYVVRASRPSAQRVSLTSKGGQQNDPGGPGDHTDVGLAATSRAVSVSGDGTRVAFDSRSTNLVPEDGNTASDVFLRDLRTASTTRVSVDSSGTESDGDSYRPSLSHDGHVLTFESEATNLSDDDSNRLTDVFVHDLRGA